MFVFSFSGKNSLDENSVGGRRHAGMSAYDEQEMSVDMLNDEFDHFNKSAGQHPTPPVSTSDLFLKAAINSHSNGKPAMRNGKSHHAPPPPPANGKHHTRNGGTTLLNSNGAPPNGPVIMANLDRGENKEHLYDNHGFEMQATEI